MPANDDMTSDLALPDFQKYRYHFLRLWWLPVLLAVLFPVLVGSTRIGGGTSTTSTATMVPAEGENQSDAFVTVTPLEASVGVLSSDDVADVIADELGFQPTVMVEVLEPTGVIEITATAAITGRAAQARDAYVQYLLDAREEVMVESIRRFTLTASDEAAALQARLDSIDDAAAELPEQSAGALLTAVDRADVNGRLIELQARIDALEAAVPAELVDVRTAALTAERGRAGSSANLIRLLGAVLAGAFLGALIIVARAYLDERVRTRSDVAALGIPAFSVIDAGSDAEDAGAIELAASIRHAGEANGHRGRIGLLGLEKAPVARVVELVEQAAGALQLNLPAVEGADSPAERARTAEASDGVILLVSPGATRQSELLNETKSLRLFGTKLLGVALVAKDARGARRSS